MSGIRRLSLQPLARLCLQGGFDSVSDCALELLIELLFRYLERISQLLNVNGADKEAESTTSPHSSDLQRRTSRFQEYTDGHLSRSPSAKRIPPWAVRSNYRASRIYIDTTSRSLVECGSPFKPLNYSPEALEWRGLCDTSVPDSLAFRQKGDILADFRYNQSPKLSPISQSRGISDAQWEAALQAPPAPQPAKRFLTTPGRFESYSQHKPASKRNIPTDSNPVIKSNSKTASVSHLKRKAPPPKRRSTSFRRSRKRKRKSVPADLRKSNASASTHHSVSVNKGAQTAVFSSPTVNNNSDDNPYDGSPLTASKLSRQADSDRSSDYQQQHVGSAESDDRSYSFHHADLDIPEHQPPKVSTNSIKCAHQNGSTTCSDDTRLAARRRQNRAEDRAVRQAVPSSSGSPVVDVKQVQQVNRLPSKKRSISSSNQKVRSTIESTRFTTVRSVSPPAIANDATLSDIDDGSLDSPRSDTTEPMVDVVTSDLLVISTVRSQPLMNDAQLTTTEPTMPAKTPLLTDVLRQNEWRSQPRHDDKFSRLRSTTNSCAASSFASSPLSSISSSSLSNSPLRQQALVTEQHAYASASVNLAPEIYRQSPCSLTTKDVLPSQALAPVPFANVRELSDTSLSSVSTSPSSSCDDDDDDVRVRPRQPSLSFAATNSVHKNPPPLLSLSQSRVQPLVNEPASTAKLSSTSAISQPPVLLPSSVTGATATSPSLQRQPPTTYANPTCASSSIGGGLRLKICLKSKTSVSSSSPRSSFGHAQDSPLPDHSVKSRPSLFTESSNNSHKSAKSVVRVKDSKAAPPIEAPPAAPTPTTASFDSNRPIPALHLRIHEDGLHYRRASPSIHTSTTSSSDSDSDNLSSSSGNDGPSMSQYPFNRSSSSSQRVTIRLPPRPPMPVASQSSRGHVNDEPLKLPTLEPIFRTLSPVRPPSGSTGVLTKTRPPSLVTIAAPDLTTTPMTPDASKTRKTKPAKRGSKTNSGKRRKKSSVVKLATSSEASGHPPVRLRVDAIFTDDEVDSSGDNIPLTPVVRPAGVQHPQSTVGSKRARAVNSTRQSDTASAKSSSQTVLASAGSSFYFNNNGEQIWLCPVCLTEDDGNLMIGCDNCDDWYHGRCLGLTAEPSVPKWFCPKCSETARPAHTAPSRPSVSVPLLAQGLTVTADPLSTGALKSSRLKISRKPKSKRRAKR